MWPAIQCARLSQISTALLKNIEPENIFFVFLLVDLIYVNLLFDENFRKFNKQKK